MSSISLLYAAGAKEENIQMDWPFNGMFGKFDRPAIQRGYKIYKEVCSACHSMKRVYFRNLLEIGFTEDTVKALASEYEVQDGPDDEGEMFMRKALLKDAFVSPYPNDNASRNANGGALPPDLSLIIKARDDGANYVYSLLTGYQDPPEDTTLPPGMHYNKYYTGHQIAMAQPLVQDIVDYAEYNEASGENLEASVNQMSYDVVNFLQWAAEQEMEERKRMGINVLIFLFFFTVFFYFAKKSIWKDVH